MVQIAKVFEISTMVWNIIKKKLEVWLIGNDRRQIASGTEDRLIATPSKKDKLLTRNYKYRSSCVFAERIFATTCLFFTREAFFGLLATILLFINHLRTVLEKTLKFKSSLIWREVTK